MRTRMPPQFSVSGSENKVDTGSLGEAVAIDLDYLSQLKASPADVPQNAFEGQDCPRRRNHSQLKQASSCIVSNCLSVIV